MNLDRIPVFVTSLVNQSPPNPKQVRRTSAPAYAARPSQVLEAAKVKLARLNYEISYLKGQRDKLIQFIEDFERLSR